MKKNLFFLLALIFMIAPAANADFYTWEDESGVSHITDYPPPQNLKKQKIKIYEESRPVEQPAAQKEKKPVIVLYTKNNCPDCDKAIFFLNSRNLAFTEYNMDEDEKAASKRKEIDGGSDVPFAIIDRSEVSGFSEAVYSRVLKLAP